MVDKEKIYTLSELLDLYNLYNIGFKYFGNNHKGDLEVYLKTDIDKISVFKSISQQTKRDYLSLNEESARKLKFVFDREVNELELDIEVIVLRTSDINIPSTRYTLKTLDKLTKEQNLELRESSDLKDGIVYLIVDNNTGCTLYDNVYLFDKNSDGFINSLRDDLKNETDILRKDNLKLILDYYDNLVEEKTL